MKSINRMRLKFLLLTKLSLLIPLATIFLLTPKSRAQAVYGANLPSAPLLAPPSTLSSWVVNFSYPVATSQGANLLPVVSPPSHDNRVKTIITTKTHQIIHEESIDGLGGRFDKWYIGSVVYSKGSGSPEWNELGSGLGTSQFDPFPASGFRDLDWITPFHYVGTIKDSEISYLVFSLDTTIKLSSDAQIKQVEAFDSYALIDVKTRLPVRVKTNGTIRVYEFKEAPKEDQVLPSDLTDQIRKGEEAFKRLNQQMPRPY